MSNCRVGVEACDRGITKLNFFGSVLHGNFNSSRSDADVLAEFALPRTKGVDFNTKAQAVPIYEQA